MCAGLQQQALQPLSYLTLFLCVGGKFNSAGKYHEYRSQGYEYT